MQSVLCVLCYLLLLWESRYIRQDAADLFSCVSWAHRLCSEAMSRRPVGAFFGVRFLSG